MGLFVTKKRERALLAEIEELKSKLSPEYQEMEKIKEQISELEKAKSEAEDSVRSIKKEISNLDKQKSSLERECADKQNQLVTLDEEIIVQEYGLYRPTFSFANSDLYKDRLKQVRDEQKTMIKNGTACTGVSTWTVDGNANKGKKMVADTQKLLLRAFNTECDDIVRNVKISNYEKSIERIWKSSDQISKLGAIMKISIVSAYVKLKITEVQLALDFAQKKQEEKERIKELKAQQREEAKAQKEIEEARKKLQKEQTHYQNALKTLNEQLKKDPNNVDLLAKKQELESNIAETDKAIQDVDYREANKRAGYVYVISNIGAFGENVYKIGMTRRLEPMDRIDELGSASVPFDFDVHALIFTEDAPGLEAALHRAFEDRKVNKINSRREFFRVSLDEVKKVVRENFDKTVEWVDVAEAEQYRQSLKM